MSRGVGVYLNHYLVEPLALVSPDSAILAWFPTPETSAVLQAE